MKKVLIILAFLVTSCNSFPSTEDVTKYLASAESIARCLQIATECVEKLKPTKNFDEGFPILIDCKNRLIENHCKESIEDLIE